MSLLYYIMRVEKYKIKVQVFGSNLTIVHDGPGIKSNLLKMSDSKMYTTSSFQCVVNVMHSHRLSYQSFPLQPKRIVMDNRYTYNFVYPFNQLRTITPNIFIIQLMTEPYLNINCTIQSFIYTGPESQQCGYGVWLFMK